jgi:hypothetical protein
MYRYFSATLGSTATRRPANGSSAVYLLLINSPFCFFKKLPELSTLNSGWSLVAVLPVGAQVSRVGVSSGERNRTSRTRGSYAENIRVRRRATTAEGKSRS